MGQVDYKAQFDGAHFAHKVHAPGAIASFSLHRQYTPRAPTKRKLKEYSENAEGQQSREREREALASEPGQENDRQQACAASALQQRFPEEGGEVDAQECEWKAEHPPKRTI